MVVSRARARDLIARLCARVNLCACYVAVIIWKCCTDPALASGVRCSIYISGTETSTILSIKIVYFHEVVQEKLTYISANFYDIIDDEAKDFCRGTRGKKNILVTNNELRSRFVYFIDSLFVSKTQSSFKFHNFCGWLVCDK